MTNPEKEIKALCCFFGISYNKDIIYPGRKKHAGEKLLLSDGGIWSEGQKAFSDPVKFMVDKC